MPSFDLLKVIEARVVGPASLWLRFSDGVDGTVDMSGEFPPSFGELSSPACFAGAKVVSGAVEWPNGFDCDPEWLRSRAALSGPDPRSNDDSWQTLRRHARDMPEISRFFGIIIRMLYDDHAPPHFHAGYGDHEISVQIGGDGVSGSFPPSRLPMLFEWRDRHLDELTANWDRMRRGEQPLPIAPLDG